jgi:ribosomal-protein-alanine N-acetyltransferase
MAQRDELRLLVAAPESSADIAALHASLFERAWDTESVRRLLDHPACLALVALEPEQRRTVGFIVAQLAAGEGEILSLGVEAALQRRGIASLLVETLLEMAQRRDVRRLFLDVADSNSAAISLYERLGFAQMGRRKAYYLHADGRREDSLLMVRSI